MLDSLALRTILPRRRCTRPIGAQITSIDRAFVGRCPERTVRGAKNGKFVYYDERTRSLTNAAPRSKPVSAYFGEGYRSQLLCGPVEGSRSAEHASRFNIDSESVDGQWKASLRGGRAGPAWKLASEKMSASAWIQPR